VHPHALKPKSATEEDEGLSDEIWWSAMTKEGEEADKHGTVCEEEYTKVRIQKEKDTGPGKFRSMA